MSEWPDDDEEFCDNCMAGVDSDEHHGKCVVTGLAEDGESTGFQSWLFPKGRARTAENLRELDDSGHPNYYGPILRDKP